MSTNQYAPTVGRAAAPSAAAGMLLVMSTTELATLFVAVPAAVLVVSLLLVPLGLAAAAALWQRRGWGMPLGLAVAGVTTIKAALGATFASIVLARGIAGAAVVFGLICCALLLSPACRTGRE